MRAGAAGLTELDAFLARVLQAYLERRRWIERLRDAVLMDFEPDPDGAARMGQVHDSLAGRLGRSVSNQLVLDLRLALALLPGSVHGAMRDGRRVYKGLRARADRVPTKPHANTGRPKSLEHRAKIAEANRRRARKA